MGDDDKSTARPKAKIPENKGTWPADAFHQDMARWRITPAFESATRRRLRSLRAAVANSGAIHLVDARRGLLRWQIAGGSVEDFTFRRIDNFIPTSNTD